MGKNNSKISGRVKTALNVAVSLAVMIALTAIVYFFKIPNPNMILIAGLTVFTTLFGFPAGIACGLEMIIYSMFFFSTDYSFFVYNDVNLLKLVIIIIGVVLNVVFIGQLKRRQNRSRQLLKEMNEKLKRDNRTLEEVSVRDELTGL